MWLVRVLVVALMLVNGGRCAAATQTEIDAYLAQQMRQRSIPGLCLAVVRDGGVVKHSAYGLANVELGVPATTNTVFEIGSITKQFTGALVLLLTASGKLALDDTLARHLPDVPATWEGITVRQLLTHTSGLKNYTGLDGFEARQKLDYAAFVRRLGKEPLESSPGEKFAYCNSGYNLLGYLIEKKSGTSYWHNLRERLLEPLGMMATRARDTGSVITNRASGYELVQGRLVNRDADLTDVYSAGAMVSTATDLLKWNAALDGESVLTAAQRQEMWTPARLSSGETYPYGLGWRLDDYQGRPSIGHSGSTSGFSASLQRFPTEKLAVIVLCNFGEQGLATKIARGVADFYFAKPLEAGGEAKR